MVQTPLNRGVWQSWNDRQPVEKQLTYDEWGIAKVRQMCPLGCWQTPEQIASLAVFLASDRAASITGQTMNVDGGWVMHW
jgi:NAD(P)-dependent dehydrogenase (short-subunit alcohol dehydrogenase family)